MSAEGYRGAPAPKNGAVIFFFLGINQGKKCFGNKVEGDVGEDVLRGARRGKCGKRD